MYVESKKSNMVESRIIAILFLVVVSVMLFGCGRDGDNGQNGQNGSNGDAADPMIYLCHVVEGPGNGQSKNKEYNMYVPQSEVPNHLEDGDYLGECK